MWWRPSNHSIYLCVVDTVADIADTIAAFCENHVAAKRCVVVSIKTGV